MVKKKGKHVLMPPFDLSWPKIDKDAENKIVTALISKLQEFPSLENKRTKDGGEKSGESPAIPQQKLSPQDEEKLKLKARLRQQVVIGFRQVSKALEWNQLALVLVSDSVQPPVLLQSLFMLVASRKCAALCFPSLHPWLTDAIGINSMLAVGFKKAQPDMPDDFGEFVSMAAALCPPLSLPGATMGTGGSTAASEGDRTPAADGASAVEGMVEEGKNAAETSAAPARDWQGMEPEQEKEVMGKLIELFKPYKTIFQTPKSKLTPEDLQTRKTVNSHILTDLGAVRNATQSEQLDLILIQSERSSPPHPMVTSVIKAAAEKGCPTLHLASLRAELGAFVQGNPVRAVGFKESQAGKAQQPEEIRQFIATATQYVPSHLRTSASSQSKDSSSGKKGENTTSGPPPKNRQKPPTPVYDVSNLYVYKKKDEDKTVPDSVTEAQPKSETYISLSEEPTVQYLGVKSLSDGTSLPGTAFVDCKSSGISGKTLTAEKCSKPHEAEQSMDDKSGTEFEGVMGLDVVDAPAVSKRSSFHEARGKKPKANLKRALDKSADRGEFVLFKVQRADVRVSVPNPNKNKKKHKKFKKK